MLTIQISFFSQIYTTKLNKQELAEANLDKTKFMCFKQDDTISTLNDRSQKLVDHLTSW